MIQFKITDVLLLLNKWRALPNKKRVIFPLTLFVVSFLHSTVAYAAAPDAVDDEFSTASGTTVTDILSGNDLNLDGPADTYAKDTDSWQWNCYC